MATFTKEITLKLQISKGDDIQEVAFSEGDDVEIVQAWDEFYLVKDDDGHLYNVAKDTIDE